MNFLNVFINAVLRTIARLLTVKAFKGKGR